MLLLVLLHLQISLQEQIGSDGRCDVPQLETSHSPCTSIAACTASSCPHGFSSVGAANCSYVVQIGGRAMQLDGCQHICVKSYMKAVCCQQHWGPLCLPCPSWSGKTCNSHGTCLDGLRGNGTCVCEEGFSGFSCQDCAKPNFHGDTCDKECDCEHGVCVSGPEGDGQCLCQPPYSGSRCDQVSSGCSGCSAYSYCKEDGETTSCECLPGHRKTPKGTCQSVCSAKDCDVNAQCSSKGLKVSCSCKEGYEGNGKVCVPINPCSKDNGGCPFNSTYCVFKGPDKSSCECLSGLAPVSGSAEFGCQLVSACGKDTCHSTAVCRTGLDGKARCDCAEDQIADGFRCYGNLMDRLIELDTSGSQRENLSGAIVLFDNGCPLLLNHRGPFTAFIPLLRKPLTGVNEELVCKNHLILGQHLYKNLEGRDFDLYGGAKFRSKANKKFILMHNPSRVFTVIQEDVPAANGIIHIIDQPITSLPAARAPPDEQFADKTIGDILKQDEKFNRFLSLVDNCGSPPPLQAPGPLTVFVPTNQAVDRARDGSILYMLTDARHKLQELLRHHVFSQAALTTDDLAGVPGLKTMANQIVSVSVSDSGQISLGDKGVVLRSGNIMASNGIIHMIDGLLLPPSILPILPHRCDITLSKIIMGPCVHCSYLSGTECPDDSVGMKHHQIGCDYVTAPFGQRSSTGCAKFCNATRQVPQCCEGFYGPDCKPCIGGFQHPCYDKGKCLDGIRGNGSCICNEAFKGVACHICVDPFKHGEKCDEVCNCVHGVCDNRPGSSGVCRRGSCLEGFSGDNCDKTATPCNSDGLHEHCHIHAYCVYTEPKTKCVCRDGYEGDGHSCSPVNLCLKSNRGGCDKSAECVYGGPGNVSCVCIEGWTGDGKVCVEINNCQLQSGGGCSPNADCNYIGPGQHECVCKPGYMGNGVVCDFLNPCFSENGGCHALAECEFNGNATVTCSCPDGYAGDGAVCYGSLRDELDLNPKLSNFQRFTREYRHFSDDLRGNLTLLIPSADAMSDLNSTQRLFWTTRHHLPLFVRSHFVPGIYSIEDLDGLVGTKVATMNSATVWEVSKCNDSLCIGNAQIITPNIPALNGYVHIIDRVLPPPLSDLPPEPPMLMTFLNSSSNFTLFRKYFLMYNLSNELASPDFTLLLPTDDAVQKYLSRTNSSGLDSSVVKYHVIPGELFPDQLWDGMMKRTTLGVDYQVQFHLNSRNQTTVNNVPLDSFMETQNGLIIFLPDVLQVQRNRCSKPFTVHVDGRCTDCEGVPICLFGYQPAKDRFPADMKPNCYYRKRVGSRRKSVPGCSIKCLRVLTDHSCCPGYYGHECFKCPGDVGNWCSSHGVCQDGALGTGECRCYEGFHGTACEDCEPGRYGTNCSSKCTCDHGKCADGLAGTGRCNCYKGWKGASCSVEIVDDACGGVCDDNANCVPGPQGSTATCACVAGYEGNGTHCKEVDLCSFFNGGCSKFANCTKLSPGERSCTCKKGYTGDGTVCLEIDGCLVNNGGCHQSAECIRTGPNMVACRCLSGFKGSGKFCDSIDICKQGRGGCSQYARCEQTRPGERNCTCYTGYVGDGFTCRGNTRREMSRQLDNAFFNQMLMKTNVQNLQGVRPFTVFVPLDYPDNQKSYEEWKDSSRLDDLVRYHIVSCELLKLTDLKSTKMAVSASGHTLHFSQQQGSVWINNRSRIVKSDYVTYDGVIHHVSTILTPYSLKDKPVRQPNQMNLTSAAVFYGYTRFYKLLEDAGLLPVLAMNLHQPFTMFWPTDEALDSLPAERQRWLSSPDHREELAAILKAHIIRSSRILALTLSGMSSTFRTMHGSPLRISCDKTLVGAVVVNDHAARIVDRYLTFREGVAYGIDQLLEPPGLGAHCDTLENKTTYGRCGSCQRLAPCPFGHHDTGKWSTCFMSRSRYRFGSSRWFGSRVSSFVRDGCKRVCSFPVWFQKCCKNHYGRDCQVCPGGVENPCSNHGNCSDGILGSGRCSCSRGFQGQSCSLCSPGYYGSNCTACEKCGRWGICEDGIQGSGKCVCKKGWIGDKCQLDLKSLPKECLQCSPLAECVPGVGCQCKPGFQGNGSSCIPEPPPDLCSEYNGGCHQDANCSQTGLTVNCTCRFGYQGDGNFCEPVNRCVEEANGGCSDFASCKFVGPNQRDCECLPGYVGNGVQCLEKLVPPVDRCLEDNGGCDPVATCKDLHYHAKTAGVFHLQSPSGKYKMNFSQADAACRNEGATLATFKQLGDAQQSGMHQCVAGWMEGAKVGYPIRFPSLKCGENHVGLVMYKEPVAQSSMYDAYCYRINDVSCLCPDDYVGNGDFCNGVLMNVLATNRNFSIFYKLLLDYSGSSSEGKELVDVLSHRAADVTLFVPHNTGFAQNKTLSERDLEYHISASQTRRMFTDLQTHQTISTRLGFNLTISFGSNETLKLVNERLVLDWDIPATNGILHVLEAPLTAPPVTISPHASREQRHSSGALSAILVLLLLIGISAAVGFSIFKQKTDVFRFHYFRNKDLDDPTGEGTKPSVLSYPNPLYSSSSRDLGELFGDRQEMEQTQDGEPPNILDLDS